MPLMRSAAVLRRQQLVQRHVDESRVAHVGETIGERQPLRLDHRVDALDSVVAHRREVEPVQQVQQLQREHALRRQTPSAYTVWPW